MEEVRETFRRGSGRCFVREVRWGKKRKEIDSWNSRFLSFYFILNKVYIV
jgi:hypothetical protein